jgi:hypothetical protein
MRPFVDSLGAYLHNSSIAKGSTKQPAHTRTDKKKEEEEKTSKVILITSPVGS